MRIPPGNTHVPCPLPIPSHSSRCAIDREAPCAPFPAQTPETQNQERATEPTPTKHLTQEDLEGIDSAVDFLEDIDGEALESIMEPRDISRCSFTSDGSSVLTERADSRASVCTPPPTFPCCRFTSSLAPATFAVPDVPCPIRTRAGEASERRLRCMLSEREKYTLDPSAWKLAPIGTIQLIAHRSGMVKFINDLRRDFGLNSRVTWRAVTFMDRYVCLVSSSETSGCKLERAELCAIVCLLLACKFQEMHFPSIPQLLESISTLYTKQELKAAEVRTPAPPLNHPHTPPSPPHGAISRPTPHSRALTYSRVRAYAAGSTERARVEPQLALAARRVGRDDQRPLGAPRGGPHASCQARADSDRAGSVGPPRCDILHSPPPPPPPWQPGLSPHLRPALLAVMTIHPMVVAAAALLVAWSLQLYGADPLPAKISASVLCDLCDVPADDLAMCEGILADLAVRAVGAEKTNLADLAVPLADCHFHD